MAVPCVQCGMGDARGSCIPAEPDGWCLRISQCEAGSAAVSAAQGGRCSPVPAVPVPCVPAVMDGWYPCSAGSALNPCSDGLEVALHPRVPASLDAWQPCIPAEKAEPLPPSWCSRFCRAGRREQRRCVPAVRGRQCRCSAWHTTLLCFCGEKLPPSLAGFHRVAGSRLRAVHPVSGWTVSVPRWV